MPLTERDVNIPTPKPSKSLTPLHARADSLSKLTVSRLPTPPNSKFTDAKCVPETSNSGGCKSSMAPQISCQTTTVPVSSRSLPAASSDIPRKKSVPADKPLPLRPITRLSPSTSSSNTDHTALDAGGKSILATSVVGIKHECSALKPQALCSPSPNSATTPIYELGREKNGISTHRQTPLGSSPSTLSLTRGVTPIRSLQYQTPHPPTPHMTDGVTSARMQQSSGLYSGNETIESSKMRHRYSSNTANARTQSTTFDSCSSSLSPSPLTARLIMPPIRSSSREASATATTQIGGKLDAPNARSTGVDTASPLVDSRPHSPSPASFSQPRRGSTNMQTQISATKVRTASRIPVKPMLVDVKDTRVSVMSMPNKTSSPAYGARRLDGPNALQILDHGVKRRQLQKKALPISATSRLNRIPTNDSMRSTAGTPSLSRSATSSSEQTCEPISPEDSVVDSSFFIDDESIKGKRDLVGVGPDTTVWSKTAPMQVSVAEDKIPSYYFDPEMESADERHPPPTSSFMAPLSTIPSESALPTIISSTRKSPTAELTRTLLQLEGKGCTRTTVDVDELTLVQMFGHLKQGPLSHGNTSFIKDATTAETFLLSCDEEPEAQNNDSQDDIVGQYTYNQLSSTTPCGQPTVPDMSPLISKWSNTTPSDKALSPPSEDFLSSEIPADSLNINSRCSRVPKEKQKSPLKANVGPSTTSGDIILQKRLASHTSIGYPSRTSSNTAEYPQSRERSPAPSVPKSQAQTIVSPTPTSPKLIGLGVSTSIHANVSCPTTVAQSKKVAMSGLPRLGRSGRKNTMIDGPQNPVSGAVDSKAQRSQSKSRYLLDRMNDLFSGRRDKQFAAAPPSRKLQPGPKLGSQHEQAYLNGGSTPGLSKFSHLPKMPNMSPGLHPALRYDSESTPTTATSSLLDNPATPAGTNSPSVQSLSQHLMHKAKGEKNAARKERLLTFAKVLNDSLISVREAHISAETAKQAANDAQLSLEMTQKGFALLSRLAASFDRV